MRKRLLGGLLLFSLAGSILQAQTKNRNNLFGMWQQCVAAVENNQMNVHYLPFLKILSKDGAFKNIRMSMESIGTFVTISGTYAILSDSTYVENIEKSVFDGMSGTKSMMEYRFLDDEWGEFSWTGTDGVKRKELWHRVAAPKKEKSK